MSQLIVCSHRLDGDYDTIAAFQTDSGVGGVPPLLTSVMHTFKACQDAGVDVVILLRDDLIDVINGNEDGDVPDDGDDVTEKCCQLFDSDEEWS